MNDHIQATHNRTRTRTRTFDSVHETSRTKHLYRFAAFTGKVSDFEQITNTRNNLCTQPMCCFHCVCDFECSENNHRNARLSQRELCYRQSKLAYYQNMSVSAQSSIVVESHGIRNTIDTLRIWRLVSKIMKYGFKDYILCL